MSPKDIKMNRSLVSVFLVLMINYYCRAGSIDGVYLRAQSDDLRIEGVKLAANAGSSGSLDLRFVQYRGSLGDASLVLREGDVVMRDPDSPSTKVERMREWTTSQYRATLAICAEGETWLVALMIDSAPNALTEKRSPGIYVSLRSTNRKGLADRFDQLLRALELSLDGVNFSTIPNTGLQTELDSAMAALRKD